MSRIEEFKKERERLHKKVMELAGKNMKAFHHLDWQTYEAGALDAKTKQMMGLVASLVLRCEDCITYHLILCKQEGVTSAEFEEALMVGLMVGGSIVLPHLRRAVDLWYEMAEETQ
jgi:AhpD family alkylhydroperoxidase